MYYVPYFKSKKHVIFFVNFLVSTFICLALFVAGVIATIVSKEPDIQNDPVVTGLVLALVIALLVNIFSTVLFIVDLVSFFVTRRKAKTMKKNNLEVVIKDAPITLKKDETLRTAIGDAIADVKSEEDNITPIYHQKEEYKPSYKKSLMMVTYANWLSMVILVPVALVLLTALVFLLNLNNIPNALIQTAIVCGSFLAVFALLIFLLPVFMVRNQKKLHPDETGIKIYEDKIEYYMHVNQDAKGQHINAILKTTLEISKMKYHETKKYFFAKQRIFKQYSVLIIEKEDRSKELLNIIYNKIKENR